MTTAMTNVITQRLTAIQGALSEAGLDAYWVPSSDEHLNEYLPDHRQRRMWISGFTGSAGDCLITRDAVWLFVDSRYHEQAETEIAGTSIQVSRLGIKGQPTFNETLQKLSQSSSAQYAFRLGFDPWTISVQQYRNTQKALERQLSSKIFEWIPTVENLVDRFWTDAPSPIRSQVYALPDAMSGKNTEKKLAELQEHLKKRSIKFLPVTKLDQVAWLFNLRGQDIPYNPVFIAYALITPTEAFLFVDDYRLEPEAMRSLTDLNSGVQILPYADYETRLKKMSQTMLPNESAFIDPKHTTMGTLSCISPDISQGIQEGEHPVEKMKAVKNSVEQHWMKQANLKASRGKIRAWYWLCQQETISGKTVSEDSFKSMIERFYAEEDDFRGLSFNTISAAGSNGAIVHYGTPDPERFLKPRELFLIDSGCQYYGGTTDDTRTWLFGCPSSKDLVEDLALQQLRYTEVLKAHINAAMQQFPAGTEGTRLDGITRSTMWQAGLDYGHGTGHGVGAFLNVHEGPNGIHRLASTPFEPGMITSIEPGFYEAGWGGIRLENLYCVVAVNETGSWLGFEPLTYIPFENRLIAWQRLNDAQLQWLKNYNAAILEKIGSTLLPEEQAWLKERCQIPVL